MLQKMQWTVAATALAMGTSLLTAARPAQAQVRYHLTRGGAHTVVSTGIVTPPKAPSTPAAGIVIPSTPTITVPAATSPKPPPAPLPVVTPVVKPAPVVTVPQGGYFGDYSVPSPSAQSSPQGFSAGPSLLGDQRLPLGRLVDRVPPAIIGDSGPTVQKVIAHR